MSNPYLEKMYPDEGEAMAFNKFAQTLIRFGLVEYLSMNVYVNDTGCGDPYCCGDYYSTCDVELRMHKDAKYQEWEIYDN